jgi:pimeloyl-ACP methyl ester carboxylesterase
VRRLARLSQTARMRTTERIASFDGVNLSCTVDGSGPDALLLHGFAADTNINWIRPGIFDALVASGRRVVAFDARGHGASDKPHEPEAYENDAMGRDASAVLDYYGITAADVIGYSMGSLTSMRLVPDEPRARSLILGGVGGRGGRRATERARIADALESDGEVPDKQASAFRNFAGRNDANDLRALAALQRSAYTRKPGGVLTRIAVPTLVVAGVDDAIAGDPQGLADRITGAVAQVVPGDHLSAVGKPELTNAIVEFLAKVSPV